jgi:hypothetical protein
MYASSYGTSVLLGKHKPQSTSGAEDITPTKFALIAALMVALGFAGTKLGAKVTGT